MKRVDSNEQDRLSDNESPIEDLLFPEPHNQSNASLSSKNMARRLRNGTSSEKDAIPTNEFIRQAEKKKVKHKVKPKIPFDDFIEISTKEKSTSSSDDEDRLSQWELVELLQEDAEEMKDFIVDDEEVENEESDDESSALIQQVDRLVEELESEKEDEQEDFQGFSDDDQCSWDSEENQDEDSEEDSLYIDEVVKDIHEELISPFTVLDFNSDSVRETFMNVTTKEKFSWTEEYKKSIYFVMSKTLKYPLERGFSIYVAFRKRKKRVSKDTLLTDFAELKVLCRDLERDVAANITRANRLMRAKRRASGKKNASTSKKQQKKKRPLTAKSIRVSLEDIIREILKIQLADFECEKEDRNIQTHKRPYHYGRNLRAALIDSERILETDMSVHASISAVNAYLTYRNALLMAFFENDKRLVSDFEGTRRYSFKPIENNKESYRLTLIHDNDKAFEKIVPIEEVPFYRALLNFVCLFLTAKMLVVAVTTNKGQKMCQNASKSSVLDLSFIKPIYAGDITNRIIKQSQELHALAFPQDPTGHTRLPLNIVQRHDETRKK